MSSARNYMSDAELAADAAYWRNRETFHKMQARTEWNPSETLREANAARMRAEASESFLRRRQVDAEQIARAGAPITYGGGRSQGKTYCKQSGTDRCMFPRSCHCK